MSNYGIGKDNAGDRAVDVYLGTDVFGRNTFGGGRMNSYLGVEAAFREGVTSLGTVLTIPLAEARSCKADISAGGCQSSCKASLWEE